MDITPDLSTDVTQGRGKGRVRFNSEVQIKGLRDLYQQVNSRLTWAQGVVSTRLQKEESKIASILAEGDDGDVEEKKELRVFEKMEKYTGRPSFGSKASIIDQFMNNKICLDTTQSSIVTTDIDIESTCPSETAESIPDEKHDYNVDDSPENETLLDTSIREEEFSKIEDVDNFPGNEILLDNSIREEEEFSKIHDHDESSYCEETRDESLLILAELMKNELDSIKQLRENVETAEFNLEKERVEFEKFKSAETDKLNNQRKSIEKNSKTISQLKDEVESLRCIKLECEVKIQSLNDQLRNTNSEWTRKSNRWNTSRKNLEEKVKELEKKCKELELEKASLVRSHASSLNTNKQIGISKNVKPGLKRIQFVDEKTKSKKNPDDPINNKNPFKHVYNQEGNKAPGYFGGSLNANKQVSANLEQPKTPLRSSLKQNSSSSGIDLSISTKNSNLSSFFDLRSLDFEVGENVHPTQLVETMMSDQKGVNSSREQDASSEFTSKIGDVEKVFPNGTRKLISKSRNFTRTIYKNGDIKEKRPDGSIHYFFAEIGMRHYIYPNGLEMTSYANGQIERKNPDGSKEILFENGCVKCIRSDGKEKFIYPDNTVYQIDEQGYTVVLLPTGQKEIRSELWKKRIFPDGTTKTIYSDGNSETRYPNGRVRIKNSFGQLISDTMLNQEAIGESETVISTDQII